MKYEILNKFFFEETKYHIKKIDVTSIPNKKCDKSVYI